MATPGKLQLASRATQCGGASVSSMMVLARLGFSHFCQVFWCAEHIRHIHGHVACLLGLTSASSKLGRVLGHALVIETIGLQIMDVKVSVVARFSDTSILT